jgi:hypothetical protein
MTDQQMPARIYAARPGLWTENTFPKARLLHCYYRDDLAERMAEALEPFAQLADIYDHFGHHDSKRICRVTIKDVPHLVASAGECRAARSAPSAFRSATQDTEAGHD